MRHVTARWPAAVILGATLLVSPVIRGSAVAQAPTQAELILTTTTSTRDAGLLDVLIPLFEQATGYRVKTIAVGSGQALALAARGEADVVLSHAPELEQRYLAEGSVINRRLVMHNDFLIVGPPGDPAGVAGFTRAADALRRIRERGGFVSRGDNSGTHLREQQAWAAAGVAPDWERYIESGQGMGATLLIASEKAAYTLTDRATYLAFKRRVALRPMVEGDPTLLNIYHVMEVHPTTSPMVNRPGGRAFADFIVSPAAQETIRTFGVDRFGEPLFVPDAGKKESDLAPYR